MPRKTVTHDDDLHLDLRQGFVQRHRMPLPAPLSHLQARGVHVPPAPSHSQGAVVKLWRASAGTTSGHLRYLQRGKGEDGLDAMLFGPDPSGLSHRAADDPHQIRGMVSLDAGAGEHLPVLLTDLMATMERDTRRPLDWVGAVHHDTAHVHAHLVIRGRDVHGEDVYLPHEYWTHGLRARVQELATARLGYTRSPVLDHVHALWQHLQERSQSHGV